MGNTRVPIKIGEKYNSLTVIKEAEKTPHGCIQWLCSCDCGKNRVVPSHALHKGYIVNCGCKTNRMKYSDREIPAKRALFEQYKLWAKTKNVEFDINENDFYKLTKKDCSYCGTSPFAVKNSGRNNFKSSYIYNGLDCIDSTKGYFLDNVVPCCKWCNFTKSDGLQKNFIEWVKKIGENMSHSEHPLIKNIYNKIKETEKLL